MEIPGSVEGQAKHNTREAGAYDDTPEGEVKSEDIVAGAYHSMQVEPEKGLGSKTENKMDFEARDNRKVEVQNTRVAETENTRRVGYTHWPSDISPCPPH